LDVIVFVVLIISSTVVFWSVIDRVFGLRGA
jgi:hypothetical protein